MVSDGLISLRALGSSAAVNEDVAEALAAWWPALGLPAPPPAGVKDLKGGFVCVAKFIDEPTCRFFFPRRTLSFQQRMVKMLTVALRKRGAKIISVRLGVEDYARYKEALGFEDTAEMRFRFASQPPDLEEWIRKGTRTWDPR